MFLMTSFETGRDEAGYISLERPSILDSSPLPNNETTVSHGPAVIIFFIKFEFSLMFSSLEIMIPKCLTSDWTLILYKECTDGWCHGNTSHLFQFHFKPETTVNWFISSKAKGISSSLFKNSAVSSACWLIWICFSITVVPSTWLSWMRIDRTSAPKINSNGEHHSPAVHLF